MNNVNGLTALPVPYHAIARLVAQRNITLFLGAAASLADGRPIKLPDGRQLASDLVKLGTYPGKTDDPLTKISQYVVEFAGDRDLILDYIKGRFHDEIPASYQCALTSFLGKVSSRHIPRLIVSTNYDTLVERTLESRSIPYVCISHVLGKSKYTGRLIVYEKLDVFTRESILTTKETEEMLQERLSGGGELVILYKMHGSAISYLKRGDRDDSIIGTINSIVLTEQDYIEFLDKNTLQRLPIQVQKLLRQSQFVFLGYSLADWNFRLLLHRLRKSQAGADTKHWAILLGNDLVEFVFWQRRGVNIHYVSLVDFLENLNQHLSQDQL